MPIPSYLEWSAGTHQTRFGSQTDEFKKLDNALRIYDIGKSEADKAALKTAFENWIAKQPGFDWKRSMRNQTGLVGRLHAALNPYSAAGPLWTAPPIPATPARGAIYLGQSFEHANSKEREDTTRAFERARLLINSAYLAIARAGSDPRERAIYETWFGPYDRLRLHRVRQVINDIHGALSGKPVILYYRGDKAQGHSDCAAEPGNITGEDYFGATWRPASMPAVLNKAFSHIFLGKTFFESGAYGQDSIVGVIIHELSHAISDTVDIVYGPQLCQQLARERPDDAVKNADCYEYLCEHLQNRSYIPRPNRLMLPKKASITLGLRAP
jgi:hypothetical protein